MIRITRVGAGISAWLLITLLLVDVSGASAQAVAEPEDRHIEIDGERLQYLDFGGEGLPVVFTAGTRAAREWGDFPARFVDRHRVVAVTDRGEAPSEGERGSYQTRAEDILALMDALDFERAVLIANANPGAVLTYLGEHHPDRLAGLVFLGNAPDTRSGLGTEWGRMMARALGSMNDVDPERLDEWEDPYVPGYERGEQGTISTPSLTFTNLEGTRGLERVAYPLWFAEQVTAGLPIPDSVSRVYFERLAGDEALQAEVRAEWDDVVAPAYLETERLFREAFGNALRVVPIDVAHQEGVPTALGYEYRDAPHLIEVHVRQFLDDLGSLWEPEGRQQLRSRR